MTNYKAGVRCEVNDQMSKCSFTITETDGKTFTAGPVP